MVLVLWLHHIIADAIMAGAHGREDIICEVVPHGY